MRIAFDGRALTSPAAGVRRYANELFAAMTRVAPDVNVTAVGVEHDAVRPAGVAARRARSLLPTNFGWSLTSLPLAIRRTPFDVFHSPAYTAPLWGGRPLVVTVHDVSYIRRPEWYPYRRDPLRRGFYRLSAARADRILTDSAFSRDEIVAAFGIDPARIDVVPLGVSERFTPDPTVAREDFVLHVGDLHPRRNLALLLDVVLALRRHDPRCRRLRLVVAGQDRGLLDSLRQLATGAADALEYVGCPTDVELVNLYRRAGAFAYPSHYEGFGLPPLEALACGAPVIAARAGALPEVVGTAAVLLPPDDGRLWREAVQAVMTDRAHAAELEARGPAHAAAFTWERTAIDTLACYRRAVEGHQSSSR